jgi:hypothetical protein
MSANRPQQLSYHALVLPRLSGKKGHDRKDAQMKKTIMLLKKIGLGRVKKAEDDTSFDKRLKKVNRTRVVNHHGLGGPVFKSRQPETEA